MCRLRPLLVALLGLALFALGIPGTSVAGSPQAATGNSGSKQSTPAPKKRSRRPSIPPPGASTSLISIATDGGYGGGVSDETSMSSDGRFVAFESTGTNLVAGDVNNTTDAFVRDTLANTTTAVSRLSAGGGGSQPSISADGRYVAFTSGDPTLVPNDTNGQDDVFVRDRSTGAVTRVSVDSSGNQATGRSNYSSISPDGRWVVFESDAANLVPNDTNGVLDVFVHDSVTGTTTRVSVASDGTQGNSYSETGINKHLVSADGRYVVFQSNASNLVAGIRTTTSTCSSTT